MVSTVTPRMVDAKWMKSAAAIAIRKALIGIMNCTAPGNSATPPTRPRAAPKPAAAEMPSVKGLARGLARIVCICAPASESEAPTVIAIRAIGMRISQMTTRN